MASSRSSVTDLDAALVALGRRDFDAARPRLIAAWQRERSPRLADLIDVVDRAAPDAVSAKIAAIIGPRAKESLERLELLVPADDPRVSRFAIQSLANLPFKTPTAHAFLTELVVVAERARDRRLVDVAPEAISRIRVQITRAPVRDALVRRIEKAVGVLRKVPDAGEAGDAPTRALIERIATELAPLERSRDLGADLLAAIHADPDDDAARLVYADWLVAEGDPRGEFIQLQFSRRAGQSGLEALAREQALWKAHARAWLGPLAAAVSHGKSYASTTFERGFLCTADIILSVGKKLEPVEHDEAWSTVESLIGWYTERFLEVAPLRSLRHLGRMIDGEQLELLSRRTVKLSRVEKLALFRLEDIDPAHLHRAFPSLQTIDANIGTGQLATTLALGVPHVHVACGRSGDPAGETRLTDLERELQTLDPSGEEIVFSLWTTRGKRHLKRAIVYRPVDGEWVKVADELRPNE